MISHIRSVSLGVPKIADARKFYEKHWQLEFVGTDDDRYYFGAACAESYVLRLRAAEEPRLDFLSLAVDGRAEVDLIADRVSRRDDARLLGLPGIREEPGEGYAFRFLDCEGRVIEVSADVAGRSFRPVQAEESRPKGINHIVLNTADLPRSKDFYEKMFDLKVSDWLGDYFCFLRSGSPHHVIALTSSPHVSLNHVAFDVRGIDEFMRATGAMMRSGFAPVWGPGRHGVGDNTFSYFQDPSSGFVMEYTSLLQNVDDSWVPRVHPSTEQANDQWGTSNKLDELVIAALRGRPDPGQWNPPPV